ncbi:MAG: sugar phosphate nucleotidyltransferase [Candidatus Micrarchaeota archaeon]
MTKIRGVVLAGGTGSRLLPLTSVCNKHLLPVYDKPMIYYPIETLKSAGITDIMVITGTHHAGAIFQLLGSGKDFGVDFTYRVQDVAGGIPSAIGLAKDFVGSDKFISINGDNILTESIKPFADAFAKGKEKARILLYPGTNEQAKKSGVAVTKGEQVLDLIEKPQVPPSTLISIGVYMYTPEVFDVIKTLKPSGRGETEITEVNKYFLKQNALVASTINGHWLDAGTVDELWESNTKIKALLEQKKKT